MYAKWWLSFLVLMTLPQGYPVAAQPYGRPQPIEDPFRQIRMALSSLKNDVSNHEAEIRTFEARLINQEAALETSREHLLDEIQTAQAIQRSSNHELENKIQSLEESFKGIVADLKTVHLQSNDSVQVLGQYKQKLGEIEQLLLNQSEEITHLESALRSMMELMQVKENTAKEMAAIKNGTLYKVQSGDSLEKIARLHKVSLKALKEANNLTSDKITIGQNLKIP